jgi:hypothetical protein
MKAIPKFSIALVLIAVLHSSGIKAGDTLKVTAELVSHYVWRGTMATKSPTPNFQPTLAYINGNVEIGVWGSTDFTGSYKEVDPYVSFTNGPLKIMITDYNWNFGKANYFNYRNTETGHILEGTFGFTGPSELPVSISLNTLFYGDDKKRNASGSPDSSKQAFSTYVELGYTKGAASLFFGFTPWAGYYNNYGYSAFDATASKKSFSIVNIGATVSRTIKITDNFSLPVRATLVINPSATYSNNDYLHLLFGITF